MIRCRDEDEEKNDNENVYRRRLSQKASRLHFLLLFCFDAASTPPTCLLIHANMAASITDDSVVIESKAGRDEISDEEIHYGGTADFEKNEKLKTEISSTVPVDSDDYDDNSARDDASDDVIIVTGADAAAHLLPLRDDREPSVTFRSLFLATCLSAFQAIMSQIYQVCHIVSRNAFRAY